MKRFLAVILVLITSYSVVRSNPFNSEEWWNRLVHETALSTNNTKQIDTSIVVVTNRAKTDNPLRFMSEEVGDGTLYYYFVYASNGKWHVLQTKNLEQAVSFTPNKDKDWVVYTEGMGKIFPSELNRGMMMSSQYDVNVIMLDYPSITTTKGMLGNYYFAIGNARDAYKYHQPSLVSIKALKSAGALGSGKLSLFFHSMGNYLLREIVKHKELKPLNNTVWVDNIILNAACVDADDHSDWLRKVFFSKNIYVHYNTEDRVLKGASLAAFETQLGKDPGTPLVAKAKYFNFNGLVGEGHSYFLSLHGRKPVREDVKAHYNAVLHGTTPLLKDTSAYRKATGSKVSYDVIQYIP